MTHHDHIPGASANATECDESIIAALLDALCSPQLYEIVMLDGELNIRPRPHMHPQRELAAVGA